MAEQLKTLEREYIIPLRRHWLNVPEYRRAGKSVKAIKDFIAKHMKVSGRDASKVRLDVYFNNELWFRGRRHPPAKIKVKAVKEGEIVRVSFVEEPVHVKFLRQKHAKFFTKTEKKPAEKGEKAPEIREEKTEEQKTDEKEKEKSAEEQTIIQAGEDARAQKHITKVKEPKIHRMALKK